MSFTMLTQLVVVPTAAVVAAICYVLFSARRSVDAQGVAIGAGLVLGLWGLLTAILAARGFYRPPAGNGPPPVGIQLIIALTALAVVLSTSQSLRGLLTNQTHLIRLNVWRLEGALFLVLMLTGQVPALWALPAGIGDLIVGVTAFWVANRFERPGGRRVAVAFNVFGLLDLVVAIGLGITTNPGPAQLFHTTPTSELITQFPLALVPGFLVPLAIAVHVVSLLQLFYGSWARSAERSPTR